MRLKIDLLFVARVTNVVKQVVDLGQGYVSQLQKSGDFSSLLQLSFQINTLLFSTSWMSCVDYANTFLKSETMPLVWPVDSC